MCIIQVYICRTIYLYIWSYVYNQSHTFSPTFKLKPVVFFHSERCFHVWSEHLDFSLCHRLKLKLRNVARSRVRTKHTKKTVQQQNKSFQSRSNENKHFQYFVTIILWKKKKKLENIYWAKQIYIQLLIRFFIFWHFFWCYTLWFCFIQTFSVGPFNKASRFVRKLRPNWSTVEEFRGGSSTVWIFVCCN